MKKLKCFHLSGKIFTGTRSFREIFTRNLKNHTKIGGFSLCIAWCYLYDLYESLSGILCFTNKLSNLTIVFFSSPLGMSPICFHYIIVVCRLYGCYCFWQYLFIATHSGRQGDIWLSWQPCVLFTSVYWVCYMEGWSRLNCRLHALPYQGEISGALRPIIFLDWLLVFLLIRIFELPRSACPIYIVTMGQQWMDSN